MPVKLTYQGKAPAKEKLDALVVLRTEARGAPPKGLPAAVGRALAQAVALGEFKGKAGDVQVLLTGDAAVPRLVAVGLGAPGALTREALRRAAGKAAQQLRRLNVAQAGLWVPDDCAAVSAEALGEALAEGLLLGAYVFEGYKAKDNAKDNGKGGSKDAAPPKAELKTVTLYDPAGATGNAAVQRGLVRGEAVCLARDLGNQPANTLTPTQLAKEAQALAKRHGLKIKVLERAELEKLGMGMFMGVAKGSRQPPKLILLEYRPARKASQTLAFVGKGITFDSGGISLKPGAAMDEMKFDMCGAAAVLGAMEGIARSKPAVNVVGIVPACENLPDGEAVKPGDILKSYAGKHVEVLNTDAEGRLILGDALAYGIDTYKPDAVVDLATLTGACVIALGHYATGAITNHDTLQERLVATGKADGDIVWPLPNFPEYGEALKGKYADLQNIGGREGGAITGGLFLKHFVGDTPWVHLDIAGTAWGVKNVGHVPYDGATGVGVCLLMDLARDWTPLPGAGRAGKAAGRAASKAAVKTPVKAPVKAPAKAPAKGPGKGPAKAASRTTARATTRAATRTTAAKGAAKGAAQRAAKPAAARKGPRQG